MKKYIEYKSVKRELSARDFKQLTTYLSHVDNVNDLTYVFDASKKNQAEAKQTVRTLIDRDPEAVWESTTNGFRESIGIGSTIAIDEQRELFYAMVSELDERLYKFVVVK